MTRFRIPHWKYLLMLCLAFVLSNSARANEAPVVVTGEQLKQSITSYDNNEFGPIKVVTKVWNDGIGTLNRSRRFQISFYQKGEVAISKDKFLTTLMVLDREKPISDGEEILFNDQTPIYDWDSAECSLEKMMLLKKNGTVYLAVAYRSEKDDATERTPQPEPAPQHIKIFKLVDEPVWHFQRVAQEKTKASVCEAGDVYKEMQKFADSTIK